MTYSLRWFDDWYSIEEIVLGVIYAIGETRYHQKNWEYLVAGRERALLFDTGPGLRNIRPVVESLTSLPVMVLPSHLHFDHTGNLHRFEDLAIADLPVLRDCVANGMLVARDDLYLGHLENMSWTPVRVAHWLDIGSSIDLGGVRAEVLHTPGHSPDSISLRIGEPNVLLAADFVYPGPLYAQIPNASLPDYLAAARDLVERIDDRTLILCGHGANGDGGPAPRLSRRDLLDLIELLENIEKGAAKPIGSDPFSYRVNECMTLLAGPSSFAAWQAPVR